MGKNKKAGSLSTPEKAIKIIEQYRDHEQKHDLIFPELKTLDNLNTKCDVQRKIAYADKRLNKALALISGQIGLTKKLTMHIARYTFGHLAGDKISIQTLQKLYRHSSITTTIGYQANFIHKEKIYNYSRAALQAESITTTVIYQNNFLHKKTDDALDAVLGN